MNNEHSDMAANAICFAADQAKMAWQEAAWEYQRPSVVFKPTLSKDGNMWCAMLGENLQEGVVGFGDTPADAMYAFDAAWLSKDGSHIIKPKEPRP
jgi:hypothetical protein